MRKRLEADLVSIAHRILQLKNKSDINQLYLESQKLYEKLSVLRFVDTHYGDSKPTIGVAEIEKEIEAFYERDMELPIETIIEMTESNLIQEVAAEEELIINDEADIVEGKEIIEVSEEENDDVEEIKEEINYNAGFEADIMEQQIEVVETLEDKTVSENIEEDNEDLEEISKEEIDEEIDAVELSNEENLVIDEEQDNSENAEEQIDEDANKGFKAAFEFSEELEAEIPVKQEAVQISFEDLLGGNYNDTLFVKVDDIEVIPPAPIFDAVEEVNLQEEESNDSNTTTVTIPEKAEKKIKSLNDSFAKGIDIDLNDQIAFVKHLFGNSNEDYNRVLNQLITFDNFYETRNFIEEMVKPDYNNWEGKDDYVDRFMDIIEKKFL